MGSVGEMWGRGEMGSVLDFVTLLEKIDMAMEKTCGELMPGLTFLHGLACESDGLTEEKIMIVESV